MPIDMELWNLMQENKTAVIGALIARFDPSHGGENPIYSPDGEWSTGRFERWLASAGITEWPRWTRARSTDGDAFRMMYGAHPAIEGLHALREVLGVIVRARIPIGPDGRNRPSLFPFGTATGRNAQAKSLFNAHASMRSFMKFPPEKIGLYLDWRTQEVGIAAARSGDEVLARDYASGDVYHALARMCGLTMLEAQPWKDTDTGKVQRQQMLDVAAGTAVSTVELAASGATAIACDFSQGMLRAGAVPAGAQGGRRRDGPAAGGRERRRRRASRSACATWPTPTRRCASSGGSPAPAGRW